jgi:hypothetical protein
MVGVNVGERPVITEHSIACMVTGALYNDIASAGAIPAAGHAARRCLRLDRGFLPDPEG